jgi:hypothetical protein
VLSKLTAPLGDKATLTVTMRLDACRANGGVIRTNSDTLPLPDSIVVTYRNDHSNVETLPERRFRAGEIETSTSEWQLNGEDTQMTFVVEPQPDGTKRVVVSMAPAKPKKTKVDEEK